jgi:uncharacterized protein YycO
MFLLIFQKMLYLSSHKFQIFILISIFLVVLKIFDSQIFAQKESNKSDLIKFQNGDLIFQTSTSSQSKAIQLATQSKYSHCGLLFKKNGNWSVLEAIQPVKITKLETWINRGENNHFKVKRLKNGQLLTADKLTKMQEIGNSFLGKDYDLTFEWSDEKIYCSELIWKIYAEGANIELCPLQKLKDFDLSNPIVKRKMQERYGSNFPLEESVVAPSALFDSSLLEEVN